MQELRIGNVPEERNFSNPISFEHSIASTARPIVLTDCLQKLASLCFSVHLEAQIRTCFPRGGPVFKIIPAVSFSFIENLAEPLLNPYERGFPLNNH